MGIDRLEVVAADPDVDDTGIALVVDLDGTLCRTDTLHEALLAQVSMQPLRVLGLLPRAFGDRAAFKAALADHGTVAPEHLPLNETVLEALRQARAAGRKTALVSASDHRQVAAVAETVGLFDEVHGSMGGRNLKSAEKAAFLAARFGEKAFDYIGDAKVDLPIWRVARRAITVGADRALRQAVEAVNADAIHLDPPQGQGRTMLQAMRPHQWSKNALLFLPLLAAHDLTKAVPVLLGFVAFCLTASAVYVINDLLDLSADRAHPRKRNRPFASGVLGAATGVRMAVGLLLGAFVVALLTGKPGFLAVLATYLVATFVYSLWLKRKLLIDVLMLAGLYTIRVLAGGAAGGINLSPWMLGFSMFIFLALAAVKRQAELVDQASSSRTSAGRAYEVEDLPVLRGIALSAGQAAVLVLALYISSNEVRALYAFPGMIWLICPLLLYWILRMVMKTHRGAMTDDPIVFAVTDRVSVAIFLSCLLIGMAAAVWPWAVPAI